MNQTAQNNSVQRTAAPEERKVTRDGKLVTALTLERVGNIIKGMKPLAAKDAGVLYKNLKVTGDGNEMKAYVSEKGKVVPASCIYNINRVSELGMSSPDAIAAYTKGVEAEKAGDFETAHDAFRVFLNKATISFNTRSRQFVNGQLVQGILTHITTERGQLLKLENVSAMQAVETPTNAGFSLSSFMEGVLGSAAPATGSAETPATTNSVAAAFASQES